jgi:hypothetical protein
MNWLNIFRIVGTLGVCMLVMSMVTAWTRQYNEVLPEALFIAAVIALFVGAAGMFIVGLK